MAGEMHVCTTDFTFVVRDEEQSFRAGTSWVSEDSDAYQQYPQYFAAEGTVSARAALGNAVMRAVDDKPDAPKCLCGCGHPAGADGFVDAPSKRQHVEAYAEFTRRANEHREWQRQQMASASPERHGETGDGSDFNPQPRRNLALESVWERRKNEARDTGMRAIERLRNTLSAEAGDRLTDLVNRDKSGADARYLEVVTRPEYERAFFRRITNPEGAMYEMDGAEVQAMRDVMLAEQERALSVGSALLPLPATIDPSILITSDGALNPIRQFASVSSIATSEWHGVTSTGVVASFDAEMAEVSDDTPTPVAPVIRAEKAQAFVEFSIEAGQDWGSLAEEMNKLFADGKDVLEADVFINGPTGTNAPAGMLATIGAAAIVTGAGTAAFAVADLYTLQNALPARYSPRARWLTSLTIANVSWQFVKPGDVTNARIWDDLRSGLLGKPWAEVSTMSKTQTTGQRNVFYGDVASCFKIVDRIGMAVELVPILLGSNRRPTGKRGLYAYWRVGSAVLNSNAARVLLMK